MPSKDEVQKKILSMKEVMALPVGTVLVATRDTSTGPYYQGSREEINESGAPRAIFSPFHWFQGDEIQILEVDETMLKLKRITSMPCPGKNAWYASDTSLMEPSCTEGAFFLKN